MSYTRQEIVDRCQLAFEDAKTFYKQDFINYCKCQYKNDQKMENKNVQFSNVYSSVCASI